MTPERLAEIREILSGNANPAAVRIECAASDLLDEADAQRLRADLACDAVEVLQRTLDDVRRGLGCPPGADVRQYAGRYAEACEALDVDPSDNLAHRIRMAMESAAHRARIAEEAVVSLAHAVDRLRRAAEVARVGCHREACSVPEQIEALVATKREPSTPT